MQYRATTSPPFRVQGALRPAALAALLALTTLIPLGACTEMEGHADLQGDHGKAARVSVRGAPILVKESESLPGDLVVVGGRATVDGEVKGNLVVIAGHLKVGPKARIGGDLVSVGNKSSHLDPAAQVKGTRVQVQHAVVTAVVDNVLWALDNPTTVVLVACFGLLLLLALAYLLMVRRYDSARFHGTVEHRPVRAALLGLIVFAALHVLAVASFFAHWGLGLAAVLWLAIGLLHVLGWLAVAGHVGRAVARRAGWQMNAALAFLLGIGVGLLAFIVPVLGQLAWAVGAWVGVGALLDPMPLAEIPPPSPAPATPAPAPTTTEPVATQGPGAPPTSSHVATL